MSRRLHTRTGFTLIEIIVVLAIVAILALVAVPSIQDRLVRNEIVEAMKLADVAKAPLAARWALSRTLPDDNAAAGLPVAEKIVSNLVSAVTVENGAIHVRFGNRANNAIAGQTLTLRAAVVADAQVVPVAWVCAGAAAPVNMTLQGVDRSSVAAKYLPLNCLAAAAPK